MTECVKTIKDLRALTPADPMCIVLEGYYEPGDGGGGTFVWNAKSNEADNGGTIITKNATSPGRWKRLFEDSLSVKWFGAKGDMKEYHIDSPPAPPSAPKQYKGTIAIGSDILDLTSTDSTGFTSDDESKTIIIWEAGSGSSPLVTTINHKNSSTQVKLDTPSTPGMHDAFVAWGTDDTDAIQKAIDVAKETGFAVYLPPGHYVVTKSLEYRTDFVMERDYSYIPQSPYPVMKRGLRMFGAGLQATYLHNLIETKHPIDSVNVDYYPWPRATIVINGTGGSAGTSKLYGSWQQTGYLKDFHIASTGHIKKTVGIDLLATWGYTIENVAVMNMGSHGIIIRNRYIDPITKSSDFDQNDKLYLDNVFAFHNDGWGIKVDAVEGAISTSKIHFERCKIEENKGGGIQWTGIGGIIEQCGIYSNGVTPGSNTEPPKFIENAYGILIKNVKGISNGLLITGCEIQGNADIQVMVEIGANIKITQNDFKDDNLDKRSTFPSIDIQVGDGNLGDGIINSQNYDSMSKIEIEIPVEDSPTDEINVIELPKVEDYENYQVIVVKGIPPSPPKELKKKTAFFFPVTIVPLVNEWILKNETILNIKYGNWSVTPTEDQLNKTYPTVISNSWKKIRLSEKETGAGVPKTFELSEVPPRTVNNCVIEDNHARISWNKIANPSNWGTDHDMPQHTVVKVNSNAIGTIIRGWWYKGPNENDKYKLVDLVENDPLTAKRIPYISSTQFEGRMHLNTSLQRDTIDGGDVGGQVLLPFASMARTIDKAPFSYTPDTSRCCIHRLTLDIDVLTMKNPTARTLGTLLFLEFVNAHKDKDNTENLPVKVIFEEDYNIPTLIIPPSKNVTGILLFGIRSKWIPFSPWTCEGLPQYLLPSGMGDPIASSNTIEPTHQIHHITGTMSISKIIPPLGFAGEIILIPDGGWKTDITGNIKNAITAIVDRPVRCIYDNKLHKWFLAT